MMMNWLVLGFCYEFVCIVVSMFVSFVVILVYCVVSVCYVLVVVSSGLGFMLVDSYVDGIFGGIVNYIGKVMFGCFF